jgi:pyruvate,water dikinase
MICAPQPLNTPFTFHARTAPAAAGSVIWLDREESPRHEVGGKGASLHRLFRLGAPVPTAFAIPARTWRGFAVDHAVPLRAADAELRDLPSMRERILSGAMPAGLRHALARALERLEREVGGHVSLAVRSSGTSEDSAAFSFAGLHDTILGVQTLDELEQAVKQCWASLWSDRAHAYRHEQGLAHEPADIAVVVQRLVPTDVSFVAFSTDPVHPANDTAVITATWGLGEAVVAGLTVPDQVSVAPDGTVTRYDIGHKHVMVIASPGGGGGSVQVPVPRALQRLPALTHEQAASIASIARALAAHLGYQVDIEGGLHGGTVHLFQARPITTLS